MILEAHTTPQNSQGIRIVAQNSGARNRARELSQPLTILGAGDACDLVLSSQRVDLVHAAIVRLGDSVYICDLGGASGTELNGRRIRWQRVTPGDLLAIGPFDFRVEWDESQPLTGPGPSAFHLRHDQLLGIIKSDDPVLLLGSDPCCDVVINDGAVAPRHAIVVWTTEGPLVRDLTGKMAVNLNGRAVREARLVAGDNLRIGSFDLLFEIESDPVIASAPELPVAVKEQVYAAAHQSPDRQDASFYEKLHSMSGLRPAVAAPEAFITEDEVVAAAQQEAVAAECEDDSGVLDFVDEIPEETYESETTARAASGDRSIRPEQLLSEKRLDRMSPDLRSRVVAAQKALDERARKLREELDAERERLKNCQDHLQEQAQRLLESAKARAATAESQKQAPQPAATVADDSAVADPYGSTIDLKDVERLFSGSLEILGPTRQSRPASPVSSPAAEPKSNPEGGVLQDQVNQLAHLVRVERDEMQGAEGRLEALRFEIERQRADIIRSREKLQVQEAEHEAKVQALRRSQAAIRNERETLVSRLRRLETKDGALNARLDDAERIRKEIEAESERLTRCQEQLDDRLRELRIGLEGERHRLRVRQAELQRKAAELVKLARTRRRAVEQIVTTQQAELRQKESQLKAQRSAIAEAGRAELEKTATELEQVLSVRLADVESELRTRQESLDAWMRGIYEVAQPVVSSKESHVPTVKKAPASGIKMAETIVIDDIAIQSECGHMALLEKELEGLHRAVLHLEEDVDRRTILGDSTSTVAPASSMSRTPRWTAGTASKFSPKFDGLRRDSDEDSVNKRDGSKCFIESASGTTGASKHA